VSGAFDLRVVTLAEFAAVDEPGADALLGDGDGVLIPRSGVVTFYGDGGAGKTTLSLDMLLHLAAGDDWLGVRVPRPARVLVIENEGPRALFRAKLRRRLAAWQGSSLDDRVSVLEHPWALFDFTEPDHADALADVIREREIDVVVVGPVTSAGMREAGTITEVRDFEAIVRSVGVRSGRPVTFALIHHANKSGQVSGAWEGVGDTLLHVMGQGHGKTRVYVQKARWSSAHHGTTMNLLWADGDGFILDDKPEQTDEVIAEQILGVVAACPGIGWTRVEHATPGVNNQRRRGIRDTLLRNGQLVNVGKAAEGHEALLDHVPSRLPARLHLPADPTIAHLRPGPVAGGTQTASTSLVEDGLLCVPASQLYRDAGDADADLAQLDDEWLANCIEHSEEPPDHGVPSDYPLTWLPSAVALTRVGPRRNVSPGVAQ
jgi:hypothetical protein